MSLATESRHPVDATHGREESLWPYFGLGVLLGALFIKSEVASWFRIQEMFHFDAVHMYGVIGSAVLVAAAGVALLKALDLRDARGRAIDFPSFDTTGVRPNHLLGGAAFGLGWGLIGACPGPLYALLGSGLPVMGVGLLAALAGAWTYGWLEPRLPH